MTCVHVLEQNVTKQHRILGLRLAQHTQVISKRAGFPVVKSTPDSGDVIVVDQDVAVSKQALLDLADQKRPKDGIVLSAEGGVARVDAQALQRDVNSVADLATAQEPRSTVTVKTIRVTGRKDRRKAATMLLRDACKKLKPGDFFGVINRELTLPLTRWLAPTRLSPNAISVIGFMFVIAAAWPLAGGTYATFLLGGFLQWFGSLMDGVDGKIARLKGQQSPFGCWLDTILDYAYYLILLGAITVGTAKTYPAAALVIGGVAVLGALISVLFLGRMRSRLAPPDHPEQFGPRMYAFLDRHKSDLILGFGHRTIRWATRAALPHIVFVAAILGILPVLLVVAALGSHLIWLIALRVNRLSVAENLAAKPT